MQSLRTNTWSVAMVVGVAFALLAIGAQVLSRVDPARNEAKWRKHTAREMARALQSVADAVDQLQSASAGIGAGLASSVQTSQETIAMFARLDSLVQVASARSVLPVGTEIGAQFFDASGKRVAWAGWPQQLARLDELMRDSGVELVYSRGVSLYQILSHFIPIQNASGQRVGTLVVDMPLEVNYRVNNRFLKSSSLASRVNAGGLSEMKFDYFSVTGNLPHRLQAFRAAMERSEELRSRRLARAAVGATGGVDSVLAFFPFSDHVEPAGDITGDDTVGLSGRVVILSRQGNPILGATVRSHTLRQDVAQSQRRWNRWSIVFGIIALLSLFATLNRWFRTRRSAWMPWVRSAVWVLLLVALRVMVLRFDLRESIPHTFDPTIFATPFAFGVFRSAGDLLITSLFMLAAVYGVVRSFRVARRSARGEVVYTDSQPVPIRILRVACVAALVLGGVELCRRFIGTVVTNANPRLVGDTVRIADADVLVLHLGTFLVVMSVLLTAVLLGSRLWVRRFGSAGMALVLVVVGVTGSAELALLALPLAVFVSWAPRFVRREDLVSFVIVSLALVLVSSSISYVSFTREYDALRRNFVMEKSGELLAPSDNWKIVILEDILEELSRRHDVRQTVRSFVGAETQRLAFDLWAEESLSLLGYSCALYVLDGEDRVLSEFSVDMPYRARMSETNERMDTPDASEWVVLDLTRTTPQGIVRFYRGILNLVDPLSAVPDGMSRPSAGKIIIDLPFFFENLELSARTGPRTPELLRNVQEGTVAPRVEEPEALLLARVQGGRVSESSSDRLPPGTPVSSETFARALGDEWPVLATQDRSYRIVAHSTGGDDTFLLAGYVSPSTGRHLLRWSTLFSLHLMFAFLIISGILLLSTVRPFGRVLPTLTPGRRLGFQQKLLASFLSMSLVPAIILGVFGADFIKGRFVDENQAEALQKVLSARKALTNLLTAELQFYIARTDAGVLLSASDPATRDIGNGRVIKRFVDTEDLLQIGPPPASVAGALHETSDAELVFLRDGDASYAGVVSMPMHVSGGDWEGAYYIFYGRRVNAELLVEVADQIGGDVNVYDDGRLIASSRGGLLAGGFTSVMQNADAFVRVSMLDASRFVTTERAGGYQYQVAYVPAANWGDRTEMALGVDDQVIVAGVVPRSISIAVPLLFRPESYYTEIQEATSLILGMFALLFTATVALGLLLARGIFGPLRALLEGTRRISAGDFTARIEMNRTDEIGAVVGAFNEMTERIARSRRELEERRRYLETILANIGTGVLSTDADHRIRAANPAAERILGQSASALVGHRPQELALSGVAPEILSRVAPENEGNAFEAGEVQISRGTDTATVKFMRAPLRHEDRYAGTVFVFEDLTELIESKKLSAWVEMSRQIAHEIKNPLTPIRISAQFMRRAYDSGSDQFDRIFAEGTETIMHQVDVLKRIAGEFSSYGRMQKLDITPHALTPLLDRIVSPYRNNEAGIAIHTENGVDDARVAVDAEAFRKICANLMENALEAISSGPGTIRVTTSREDAQRARIVFRDSGPGLETDVAERLFEPYFSTKTTGTGLGLAICRTLAREMGGDVLVRNATDGGPGVEAVLLVRSA